MFGIAYKCMNTWIDTRINTYIKKYTVDSEYSTGVRACCCTGTSLPGLAFSLVQAIMARRPIVGGNWKCNPDSIGKLDELIKHMPLGQIGNLGGVAVWILVHVAVGCFVRFHMKIKWINIVQQVQSSLPVTWYLTWCLALDFRGTLGFSIRKQTRSK